MSAITDSIQAAIVSSMDPNAELNKTLMLQFLDTRKSAYQQHMESGCEACKNSADSMCQLAKDLREVFRRNNRL